ncbi:MAG TPA: hypothetical protein VIT68_03270 [Candidatus Gracilibacteria bacterium]
MKSEGFFEFPDLDGEAIKTLIDGFHDGDTEQRLVFRGPKVPMSLHGVYEVNTHDTPFDEGQAMVMFGSDTFPIALCGGTMQGLDLHAPKYPKVHCPLEIFYDEFAGLGIPAFIYALKRRINGIITYETTSKYSLIRFYMKHGGYVPVGTLPIGSDYSAENDGDPFIAGDEDSLLKALRRKGRLGEFDRFVRMKHDPDAARDWYQRIITP